MKAKARDVIRTVLPVESDFDDVAHAAGLLGDIVEAYSEPREAYAIDLAIPDPALAGGYRYDNVLLTPCRPAAFWRRAACPWCASSRCGDVRGRSGRPSLNAAPGRACRMRHCRSRAGRAAGCGSRRAEPGE